MTLANIPDDILNLILKQSAETIENKIEKILDEKELDKIRNLLNKQSMNINMTNRKREIEYIKGRLDKLEHTLLSINVYTCKSAAKEGLIEFLKYAHENYYPWDPDTCSSAAEGGHLNCLRYAHDNGCPWNEDTCRAAAEGGHLNCLRYAHDNDCPWNEDTCRAAHDRGHIDCHKYAYENGCPCE
jgi:hypothetical protein